MDIIISNQNQSIKEIKSLKHKKYREEKGLFFIEGIRFVEEAVLDNAEIERVLISESFYNLKDKRELLNKIEQKKLDTIIVSDKLFNEISDTQSPQGILAVLRIKYADIEEILCDDNFLVILDSIQDPGNLGTILRTADAAGATGVIMSHGCVDLYNPKVLRSTMGSIFHIPVCLSSNLTDVINRLKSEKVMVCAAHLQGNINYFDLNMKSNIAIVIGNEANGINDEISDVADTLIKIPMPGRSESLNASVAASILIYEVVSQRMK